MSNLLSYFFCPRCHLRLEFINKELHCNNCNYCLVKNKNIWRPKNRKVSKYKYWQDSDGTRLKERAEAEFSTSKFEFVQYKKIINASLKLLHKNCVILELGAGDGRFTQLLAAENYVIVNDINFNSLCRLSDLSINNSNLIFICCSFDSLPIKKNSIDMIAAIECLYYSNNEFDYVLSNILKLLKQDGLFLNSEPLIDGAAIYNLIKLDFEQAGINLRNKIKIESMDDSEIKGRLFNKSSLRKILKNNYLEILIEKDIPLIFSIVSYLSSRYKNTIRQSVARNLVGKCNEDYSDSGRCYATLSKKVGDPSK